MADTFGALQVPAAVALGRTAAGDPMLSTSLSFFAAILNAYAPAAWTPVYRDVPVPLVVKATQTDNPSSAPFNERDLPALFFWRESADDPVWIAEDYLTQKSNCRLQWVMPAGISVKTSLRSSVINAVARALLVMVERNRDPAWIDDGDSDPLAATLGSSHSARAGWMEFYVGKWKSVQVPITIMGKATKPQMYDALSIDCTVIERLTYDLTRFDAANGLELTMKTADQGVGDGGFVTEHIILP